MNSYKKEIAELLTATSGVSAEEIIPKIVIPPENIPGDLSVPCFTFAKQMKKAPKIIAEELAANLNIPESFNKVVAVNGYLNFFLDQKIFSRQILTQIATEKKDFGNSDLKKDKVLTLDFSSPNMGKELAFHHLRGTMLGNSLSRILKKVGYQVVRINHLGDWGTSYGKLIVMYLKQSLPTDEETLTKISIESLNQLYQSFATEAIKNPDLEDEARIAFQELENGNELYQLLWKVFRQTTLKELKRIYNLLEVEFDSYRGEADYIQDAKKLISELEEKEIITESRGAKIVDLENQDLPPLMMQKSDGSTLYATRDLCAAIYRAKIYGFEKNLYVVDNGQGLHFTQLFLVLKKMGMDWHKNCIHVPFGLILNKSEDGKWEKGKTKAGNASLLKEVIEEASNKVDKIIEEKNPVLENRYEIAQKIAIGALTFNDLKTKRMNDVKFEWDKVLSFEGDTGPYVVNAYVRLSSILRKSGNKDYKDLNSTINFDHLQDSASLRLIHNLSAFPDKVIQASESYEPYLLGQYALSTAEKVHQFIHHCRVIGSEEEKERLFLVHCTRIVLGNTLQLLGIPLVESM